MNDTQRDKMLSALADAFDSAATTTSHKRAAALQIEATLRKAGYGIALRSLGRPAATIKSPLRGGPAPKGRTA